VTYRIFCASCEHEISLAADDLRHAVVFCPACGMPNRNVILKLLDDQRRDSA
jgi:hypothetical protein